MKIKKKNIIDDVTFDVNGAYEYNEVIGDLFPDYYRSLRCFLITKINIMRNKIKECNTLVVNHKIFHSFIKQHDYYVLNIENKHMRVYEMMQINNIGKFAQYNIRVLDYKEDIIYMIGNGSNNIGKIKLLNLENN